MATEKRSSEGPVVKILALIVVLSLGLNGILWIKRTDTFPSKKELMQENKKLDRKLDETRDELNRYKGINAKIDQVLQEANATIDASERRIVALSRDKNRLLAENENLLMEVDSLRESYLDVIDSLLVEQEEQNILNQKIASLEEVISGLNKKLGVASWLLADNLKVMPKKENILGNMQQSAIARKVEDLQVCLDILENRIAKSGDRTLYFIITAPDGTILTPENQEAKTFQHPEYDKQSKYSKAETVNYQNQKTQVCMTLNTGGTLKSGLYVAEVFSKENKLGMTTFSLK